MKLISLEMNNFRQFYGKQKLEFSLDPEKNVTLIHGENGVGKTALLNAIKWCFHERTTDNFSQPKQLLNHFAEDKGEKSYHVAVAFEGDGHHYHCERGFDSVDGKHYLNVHLDDPHTGMKPVKDAKLLINTILPVDMSEYFFFQGEGVGGFAGEGVTSGHKSQVKEAIHNVLGFKVAESTLKDIASIKKDYHKAIAQRNHDPEISKLYAAILQAETRKKAVEEDYKKNANAVKLYEGKVREIDKILANSNAEVVKKNQVIRKRLSESKERLAEQIQEKGEESRGLVKSYAPYVFAKTLASQALDFINEEEFRGTIPAPYNESLVKNILEQKECICGADITANPEALRNIRQLLMHAADPDQGDRVIRARATLQAIQTKNEDAKERLLSNRKDLERLHYEIEAVKKDIAEISLEMTGCNISEIANLEKEREINQRHKDVANRKVGSFHRDKKRFEVYIEKQRKTLETLKAKSKGKDIYEDYLKILEGVEALLQRILVEAKESAFDDLSALIHTTTMKYVKQDYKATIDRGTFNIALVDSQDRKIAMSDGQRLLISLIFISSLIELAAKRKDTKGEILTSGVIAPFVIDAPFGNLDNTYKGNMAKSIPESVGQVVLLLSSSHWEGSVEENIRSKVGKEYNLVSEVRASQGAKTLNPLYIRGREMDTVRYDCAVERTVIEEVIA